MRLIVVVVLVLGLIVACDSKPPETNVFDAQVQALKKARETKQKVEEGERQRMEQIERQTQSSGEKQ